MRTETSVRSAAADKDDLSDFEIISLVVIADCSLSPETGEEQRSARTVASSKEDSCGWREEKS